MNDSAELQASNLRVWVVIVIAAVLMIWRSCVWVRTLPERHRRGEFGSARPFIELAPTLAAGGESENRKWLARSAD